MPELPEIETIRRGLQQEIAGQLIGDVRIGWVKTMPYSSDLIESLVVGQAVRGLERRAKVLIWHLANKHSLLFHLKMTGQMVLVRADGERFAGGHPTESMAMVLPDRSTRAVFTFGSGDKLFFNDQRKFGWIKLVPTREVELDPLIKRLGPEPLSEGFTPKGLEQVIKRRGRSPIKALILDQSTVSGVGNIYADESLHLARIHPARLGNSLSPIEIRRLHEAIKKVIELGIEHGGTSFTSYVNALGQRGDYLQHARVFRQQGLPCSRCGTVIEKIRVAGRGTHVCPGCQKAC
jgi:formamidopyrimidine-DNA glycosylase